MYFLDFWVFKDARSEWRHQAKGERRERRAAASEAGTAGESTQNAHPPQSEKAATEETEREHKPPTLSTRINTHKVSPRHKLI